MPIRPPKIRLPPYTALRAFETAARHESFVAAADELGVTPGAVAQQVKALEAWLGAQLFERQSHGVVLTPHGRGALPRLSYAIDALGAAVQALRGEARPHDVHIAALPAIAQLWLSPRLPRLRRAFPELRVSVTALEEPPNFKRDLFDLGLFYSDPIYSDGAVRDCISVVLAHDRLLPACAPDLAETIADLAALRRQTLLHDTSWSDDWPRWLKAVGAETPAGEDGPAYSLYSIAVQSAIDGNGLLMGRESLIAGALADGRLVAPFAERIAIPETLDLLVPTHRADSPLLQSVAAWLREAA